MRREAFEHRAGDRFTKDDILHGALMRFLVPAVVIREPSHVATNRKESDLHHPASGALRQGRCGLLYFRGI